MSNRVLVVLLTSALGASAVITSASAADRGGSADLERCRDIPDKVQRLACYDGMAAASAPALPAKQPVPDAAVQRNSTSLLDLTTAASHPAATSDSEHPAASFGSESLERKTDKASNQMAAHVVGTIDGINRHMQFGLDNGQVWMNVDDQEYDYEAQNPAVTIERSLIGTYWMQLADAPFRVKVLRVK